MKVIERCFLKLRDKPCWNVECGYAQWLTLEFGKPSLQIIEPHKPSRPVSARVQKLLYDRRHVIVRGQWQLTIEASNWVVRFNGKRICATMDHTAKAVKILWGQKLTAIAICGTRTLFTFDLGAEIEVRPLKRQYCQWQLRDRNDYFLSFRGDGKFAYAHGSNLKPEWHRL